MFNHDSTFHGKSEYPQRIDELLDKLYGPLQNTQVGALSRWRMVARGAVLE